MRFWRQPQLKTPFRLPDFLASAPNQNFAHDPEFINKRVGTPHSVFKGVYKDTAHLGTANFYSLSTFEVATTGGPTERFSWAVGQVGLGRREPSSNRL